MIDHPGLIEHSFPLKQASLDSVRKKNVRHGHISTVHMWPAPPSAVLPDKWLARVQTTFGNRLTKATDSVLVSHSPVMEAEREAL